MATFCLLHGKWHDPACWQPLVGELEQRGHRCVTPGVPFDDPTATYEQRALPAIEELGDADTPVVVVGHSLAAGVAPLVAAGATASLVVYLCPAPTGPFEGVDTGTRAIRRGFPFPPDREDGTSVWDPGAAIAAMYPRLPDETARELAARLRPGCSAPDAYPLESHPGVPAALVYASADEFFEPEWSRRVAAAALGGEAVEIATGHFPMIEAPGELARLLDERAGGPSAIVALVRAGYDTWNRLDLDGWLAFLDPDVVLDLPGIFPDFERVYRGHEGVTRFWGHLHDPWEEFHIDVERIEEGGDMVVVALRFRAKGAGSGAHVDMRYGHAIRFRGERAVEIIARRTPEEAERDLRASAPATGRQP